MLGDLGKLIVAKGFKNLPKVQKIARSGHTGLDANQHSFWNPKFEELFEVSFLQVFLSSISRSKT